MNTVTTALAAVWRFVVRREPAVVIGAAVAVLLELDAVLELVAGDLEAAGGAFTWSGLLAVAGGVLTRLTVFARSSVDGYRDLIAELEAERVELKRRTGEATGRAMAAERRLGELE